jgi:hypothetical protein
VHIVLTGLLISNSNCMCIKISIAEYDDLAAMPLSIS